MDEIQTTNSPFIYHEFFRVCLVSEKLKGKNEEGEKD